MEPKRVVIIGGGFAGSCVARYFERHHKDQFRVTLIDTKNYFEFTPSILRVLVEAKHLGKIQVLHKHYLHRTDIVEGDVEDVSSNNVVVKTHEKDQHHKTIPFDYLVISSGSNYALPFKEQDTILPMRAEHLLEQHKAIEAAKKILIIGGGLVGVEIAGELLQHYGKEKEVTIVHSKDELIERQPAKARAHAKKVLERMGAKIFFNDRVEKKEGKTFVTRKGIKIHADLSFSCVGIKPNYLFMSKHLPETLNEHNTLVVNDSLQVINTLTGTPFPHIFGAGDITNISEEKTAQNAEEQGKIVACNIVCAEAKKELSTYEPKPRIMIISLGKYNGVITYKHRSVGGLLAGFMKWAVEKREMMKFR